jgi:hypothetical protein
VVSCLRACSLKSVKLQLGKYDLCIGDSVAATVMAAGAAIAEDILFRGDFEFLKFENNLHMFHLLSGLFTFENLWWREAKRDAGRKKQKSEWKGVGCGALDNALQPVYAVVERWRRQSGSLPLAIVVRDDYNIRSCRSFIAP